MTNCVNGEVNAWNPGCDSTVAGSTICESKNGEQRFVATLNQMLFTLTAFEYTPGTNSLAVHKNGLLIDPINIQELSPTSFWIQGEPVNTGDIVVANALTGVTAEVVVEVTDIFTEVIVLNAGQLLVPVTSTVPLSSAAVYIRGLTVDSGRLVETVDYNIDTINNTITLVDSYPAGTRLVIVYNDVAASTFVPNYEITVAEDTANVTPVDLRYIELNFLRYGADPTGVVPSTQAWADALAVLSVSGGTLYIPSGTYVIDRGDGSTNLNNVLSDNCTIRGDGPATILQGRNAAGVIPDDPGNQYYNFLQATSQSNIVVRDLHFEGFLCLISTISCSNVIVENVSGEGLLANASNYLLDKACWFDKTEDIRVTDSVFKNYLFATYFFGTNADRCKNIVVSGNHYEHTVAAGAYTALFPVGVYPVYVDECIIANNTFKNIYSSVDSGSTATGMGFGVYEGDGASDSLIVDSNTFLFEGKGLKNAHPWYISEVRRLTISNNLVKTAGLGCRNDTKDFFSNGPRVIKIQGNQIETGATTQTDAVIINISTADAAVKVSNNYTKYSKLVAVITAAGADLTMEDNVTESVYSGPGMQVTGLTAATTLVRPKFYRNTIIESKTNGLLLNAHTVQAQIIGNTFIDCDQAGGGAEADAWLRSVSFSFGSIVKDNNFIANPGGGGTAVYSISNASGQASRPYKDIINNNVYEGFGGGHIHRQWTVSPTNGIYDICVYDPPIANSALTSGGVPGWQCVVALNPVLVVDASNAGGTQITVSSTSSMLAGDIILLVKNTTPGWHADANDWHVSTIASIDSGTQLTLNDAIPVGDGTYVAGTAFIKTARFKALAAIAS